MKKIITMLTLVLALSGCASKKTPITSVVTDQDTVVATINGTKVTKKDVYQKLLASSGSNLVVDHSLQVIANQLITDETLINEKAQETIDAYIKMLGSEEAFNKYLTTNSYDSVEAFKAEQVIPSVKITLLIKQYVEDNFTTLANEYGYSYIQSFKVDTESEAMEIISKISSGEVTFAEAAKTKTDKEPENVLCYTAAPSSVVDSKIALNALKFDTVALYTTPIATSDSKYAIVNVVDVDREANKEEIVNSLLGIQSVNSSAQAHYLTENNFTVYEKGIEEEIKATNKNYLK